MKMNDFLNFIYCVMDINEQFESLMENSTEINEAEEVDIKYGRKPRLGIKYWETFQSKSRNCV